MILKYSEILGLKVLYKCKVFLLFSRYCKNYHSLYLFFDICGIYVVLTLEQLLVMTPSVNVHPLTKLKQVAELLGGSSLDTISANARGH